MNIFRAVASALLATALITGNAHASSGDHGSFWGKVTSFLQGIKENKQERKEGGEGSRHKFESFTHRHFNGCHGSGGHGNGHQVPEMDAAGAGIALGLLGGLAALRRERMNSKKMPEIS